MHADYKPALSRLLNLLEERLATFHTLIFSLPLRLENETVAAVNMDVSTQHTFLSRLHQPQACFAIACVTVSLVAITTIWRNGSGSGKEFGVDQRPRPQRRMAADELYERPQPEVISRREPSPSKRPMVIEDSPIANLTALVSSCAKGSQRLREISREYTDITIATLLTELSLTTTALCRLQQPLCRRPDVFEVDQGLTVCFQTAVVGLSASLSILDAELSSTQFEPSPAILREVVQQLRDHRLTLSYLLDNADM